MELSKEGLALIKKFEPGKFSKRKEEKVKTCVNAVNSLNYEFNQNEFDALVSFAYSGESLIGITNCERRSKYQIAQKFRSYILQDGKKSDDLVLRRKSEYELFVK